METTQYSTVPQDEKRISITKDDDKKKTLASPPHRRLRTAALFLCFTALGIGSSIVGPTLVHMRHLLDVDIAIISLSFTCQRLGFLIGSLTCGLIYDRVNAELQMLLSTLLLGFTTMAMPFAPMVYMFFVMNVIQAFYRGYLDTAAHPYIITLWAGHKLKEPMMQALHAVWAVGSTISPLIASPFLVELPLGDYENSTITPNETFKGNWTHDFDGNIADIERVRFGYICVGLLIALFSFSFVIPYLLLGPSCFSSKSSKKTSKHEIKEILPKNYIRLIVFLQFFAFIAYVMYESIPAGFLTAFVIEGLHWEVRKGPWITGLYWGSNALGRMINTFLSYCLSPSTMLNIALMLTSIAFLLMFIATLYIETLLWVAVAMAGFAMSSTFASMFLWNSNIMEITGAVAGILLAGGSIGGGDRLSLDWLPI